MPKIDRLSEYSDWVDLSFVERERTLRQLMVLGTRFRLAEVSLSNTVRELDKFGVEQSRKALHDWVHKCDQQPTDEAAPNHVALDETEIRIDDQQYWLYAVVDPDTNQ